MKSALSVVVMVLMSCRWVHASSPPPAVLGWWTVSASVCESQMPCLPTDVDCDCDKNLSTSAPCRVSYSEVLSTGGMPTIVSKSGLTCNNCGGCCDGDQPPPRQCVASTGVLVTTQLSTSISHTVSGAVGVPGVATLESMFESASGLQVGASTNVDGQCGVPAAPCTIARLDQMTLEVTFDREWWVYHTWQANSTWAVGSQPSSSGCVGRNGVCPLAGQGWNAQCPTVSSMASAHQVEGNIDCGIIVVEDCP